MFNELFNMCNIYLYCACANEANIDVNIHISPSRNFAILHIVAKTWVAYGAVFFHIFKDLPWF